MKTPRKLKEEEIMVKVSNVTNSEVTLVLYTKPTIVTNIMDETFGPENWEVDHTVVAKGNGQIAMICKVTVWDTDLNRKISRTDVGEPVGINGGDKSQATDALKRACALFGVAKELKTMPEAIVVRSTSPKVDASGNPVLLNGFPTSEDLINITANDDGTFSCHDVFSIVQYLTDEQGNISALCIQDETTKHRVFTRDYRIKDISHIPPSSAIVPLQSSELARYTLLVADVGAFAKQGQKLGDLEPDELRWLFGQTKSSEIKRGCLEIAEAFPEIKNCFLKGNINPDQLLKEYR